MIKRFFGAGQTPDLFQKIKVNKRGRDYICSDVHGHFSLLEEQLGVVGFDVKTDRLFSLGDLIDRGDESCQVLEWLEKPWFYAIQGNHERMLINVHESEDNYSRFQWFSWGGAWAEQLEDEELTRYYEAMAKLPLAIELELVNNKKIALVHAELPSNCDWNEIKKILLRTDPGNPESSLILSDMLWNRSQPHAYGEKLAEILPVKNIDHVFHGHTIVDDYLTITNRTFMDLGSYATGLIGLLDPVEYMQLN